MQVFALWSVNTIASKKSTGNAEFVIAQSDHMKFKIYTLLNCFDCAGYHRLMDEFCKENAVRYELVDIDSEAHFHEIMKYKLVFIPSTILFGTDGEPIVQEGGLLSKQQLTDMLNYEHTR